MGSAGRGGTGRGSHGDAQLRESLPRAVGLLVAAQGGEEIRAPGEPGELHRGNGSPPAGSSKLSDAWTISPARGT